MYGRVTLLVVATLVAGVALAAEITVTNGPRTFSIMSPDGWTRERYSGDNEFLALWSPEGKPTMRCGVNMVRAEALKDLTQEQLNQIATKPRDKAEMEQFFGQMFDDAKIHFAGGSVMGGQLARVIQFSGRIADQGETAYVQAVQFTQTLVTGIAVVLTCQGMGHHPSEAQQAFDYWKIAPMQMAQSMKYLQRVPSKSK